MLTRVKTAEEIINIRQSGQMLAAILEMVKLWAKPGISGLEIDRLVSREIKTLGGKSACLGYQGFPKSICISVDDEIVHAIPDDRPFEEGQVIGFDYGVNFRGMITDAAMTMTIGQNTDKEVKRLLKGTQRALAEGIAAIDGPVRVGQISAAIEDTLQHFNLGIVRELVGHGVGHDFHEEPNIPNYREPNAGILLKAGMTVAIEPMATLGSGRVKMAQDGWAVLSADGSLSAQFEHTVLITPDGAEILTKK